MILALFTVGTKVEILADATLVACADDRSLSTSVAFDLVDGLTRKALLRLTDLRTIIKIIKNLGALLIELFFDKPFEGFSRETLVCFFELFWLLFDRFNLILGHIII